MNKSSILCAVVVVGFFLSLLFLVSSLFLGVSGRACVSCSKTNMNKYLSFSVNIFSFIFVHIRT